MNGGITSITARDVAHSVIARVRRAAARARRALVDVVDAVLEAERLD